jgi:hypothetical protein
LYFEEESAFADLPQFLKIKTDRKEDGELRYTPEMNKQYYFSLLKAAGHIPKENKTVILADAGLFPHVVQYLEMIFWRHDKNRNTFLEKDEALAAFPIFERLITDLAKAFPALKPADMPGVFIYLLKFGKPPKTLPEKLKFATFVKDHDCSDPVNKPCQKDWDIMSSRHDLGKIFNFIADATRPKPPGSADEATATGTNAGGGAETPTPAAPQPAAPQPAAPQPAAPQPAEPAQPQQPAQGA